MEENKPEIPESEQAPLSPADQTFKPTIPKLPAQPEAAISEPAKTEATAPSALKLEQPEAEAIKPSEKTEPPPLEKKRPSFWTRAFRWLVGILILFGLGSLLVILTLYMPARREIEQLNQRIISASQEHETDLASAQQEIDNLKMLSAKNEELQTAIEELKTENDGLLKELEASKIHLILLQVRIDAVSAQVALLQENPGEARLALSNTAEAMEQLKQFLPEHQEHVQDMLDRLERIMGEIDDNPDLAILDLDSLLNDLLWLEDAVVR